MLLVCDCFKLSLWLLHGNRCVDMGCPAGEHPLESPMTSAPMPSPTAQGMKQEPSPVTPEQMLLPVALVKKQEPSPLASDQKPSSACDCVELLPTESEQIPSPVCGGSKLP